MPPSCGFHSNLPSRKLHKRYRRRPPRSPSLHWHQDRRRYIDSDRLGAISMPSASVHFPDDAADIRTRHCWPETRSAFAVTGAICLSGLDRVTDKACAASGCSVGSSSWTRTSTMRVRPGETVTFAITRVPQIWVKKLSSGELDATGDAASVDAMMRVRWPRRLARQKWHQSCRPSRRSVRLRHYPSKKAR